MTATATTMPRMGRKRRPAPRGTRTLRQRFARRLHELAGDRSNKEIAEACRVSPMAVSKWFAGLDAPSFDVLIPLAKCLGVTVRDLFPE